MKTKQTFWKRMFTGSGWTLFTLFVWEMLEESLEILIAYLISSALAIFAVKILSTLAIVTATQSVKAIIKRTLLPYVKKIIYKKGNDKVEKLKEIFRWIWANKKTLVGVTSGAVATLSGSGIIDVSGLPPLVIAGFDIAPLMYYGALLVLTLIGVFGKGLESVTEFFERMQLVKTQKEEKAILKQAKKEIAYEQKLANQTQAEQEKMEAKAQAEKELAEAKAQAEAEYRARVDAIKNKLKTEDASAENQNS